VILDRLVDNEARARIKDLESRLHHQESISASLEDHARHLLEENDRAAEHWRRQDDAVRDLEREIASLKRHLYALKQGTDGYVA
jgi:uncharacterized coiled-coil protein SlyX